MMNFENLTAKSEGAKTSPKLLGENDQTFKLTIGAAATAATAEAVAIACLAGGVSKITASIVVNDRLSIAQTFYNVQPAYAAGEVLQSKTGVTEVIADKRVKELQDELAEAAAE